MLLGPTWVHNPNVTSIGSAVLHGSQQSHYTLQRAASLPLIIAPSHGGSEPPSNTLFLGLTRILNLNGISTSSAIFTQLMTKRSYTLKWAALPPQNCPLLIGRSEPHLICGSLGLPDSASQMATGSVRQFLHSSRQSVPILHNELLFPPQNCPFPWGMWTHLDRIIP